MANPDSLYSLLNEIYLILDDGDRQLLGNFNLTSSRYYALVHIGDQPGMSLSELSSLMLCDKSNATRIIKSLEADGLVYRKPHETDGRTLRLYLTERGEQLRKEAIFAHQNFNSLRFEDVDQREIESLARKLLDLRRTLQDRLEDEIIKSSEVVPIS